MRGLIRGVGFGVVPAALLLTAVTGCSGEPGKDKRAGSAASPAKKADSAGSADAGAVAVAKKGGSVGGAGSPCALPVTFDLAAGWQPEAVDTDGEFGALTQGPVTLSCEIDAKPAGNIGFLRVWTGSEKSADVRADLKAFVAEEAAHRDQETYTDLTVDGLDAAEIVYVNTSDALDAPKKERALALATPKGVVVLHLGGLDSAEHDAMLPAYELAKRTLQDA
ncbi:lipoprotein [Streptomyces sp. NBC_00370]|uniref:lipoprotein n=1 Tax=Streptomyces sp. NBC_00370 TaxID=2975728 RepID=UPI002E253236